MVGGLGTSLMPAPWVGRNSQCVQYEHVGFLWNMLEHLSMLKFVMRIGKATKDEIYAHSNQGFLKSS
jgi:hypothetical protein